MTTSEQLVAQAHHTALHLGARLVGVYRDLIHARYLVRIDYPGQGERDIVAVSRRELFNRLRLVEMVNDSHPLAFPDPETQMKVESTL